MNASWRDLNAIVAGFDGDLSGAHDDVWTVHDAVIHLAIWERVAIRRINGTPLPVGEAQAAREPWDIDVFNDALLDLWRDAPDADVLAEFDAAHRALVEVVSAESDEACAPDGRVAVIIAQDGAGHYHLHFPVKNLMEPAYSEAEAQVDDRP